MKKLAINFLFLFTFSLAACQSPLDLSMTGEKPDTATTSLPPSLTQTINPDWIFTHLPENSVFESKTCNMAAAGTPFDITIPDGTLLKPGVAFTKSWRILNTGNCTWDREYAVEHFSGENMSMNRIYYLESEIKPGDSVDIEIEMFAPLKPGLYQSFWKLRNPEGQLFGIGPKGEAAFWVRIQVMDTRTPTPTIISSPTPTIIVYKSGALRLKVGESIDLDKGIVDAKDSLDILLKANPDHSLLLEPLDDCTWAIYGQQPPTMNDCHNQQHTGDPLNIMGGDPSLYICYMTGEGLPGYFRVSSGENEDYLVIEYVTWEIP